MIFETLFTDADTDMGCPTVFNLLDIYMYTRNKILIQTNGIAALALKLRS